MVAAPPLDKDISSPQPLVVGCKVVEVRSMAVCTPGFTSVGASVVVVREPTEELVSRAGHQVTLFSGHHDTEHLVC
jgi:hypothetical protein